MDDTSLAGGRKAARFVPVLGIVLTAVFGLAIVVGSLQLPASRTADVGGGRMPMLIGIAIIALSIVQSLSMVRAHSLVGAGEQGSSHQRLRALILLGLLVFYCVLMSLFGVIASTAVFMMCVMLWLDTPRRWLRSAIITIVFLALIYALFNWVIGMPLP